MIKGLYAAVSGMLTNINRQQTISHNVANLTTPGFKQILTSVKDFTHTEVVFPPGNITHQPDLHSIGTIGLGVMSSPDTTDFNQGGIIETSSGLDLAIEGSGFFQVQTENGKAYTRDGRFIKDSDGQIVTVDGYHLLDSGGKPIKLEDGYIGVKSNGVITVNGEEAATIGLAVFENPKLDLVRAGDNTYTSTKTPGKDKAGKIAQYHLETSNADATQLMTQLVEVARSYEASQQMVQNQDELLGKTISSLGRIG
jgi:flagellar basal-body rod protein FlgF